MRVYLISLRILTCLALFCAACSLSCRRKTTEGPQPAKPDANSPTTNIKIAEPNLSPTEPKAATEKSADNVAVTVNGFKITEAALDTLMKPYIDRMGAKAQQLPPQYIEQYKANLRTQALEKMIVERLLDEKVKEANITITDQNLTDKLTEIASTQKPPLSVEEFKKKLESYGQSFDDVKKQVGQLVIYEKLLQPQWAGKINITEEDAKKFYDENLARYSSPEQVRASHILIQPKDVADPNSDPNQAKAKALAKAQGLLKQIRDGADFAELAKANSSDVMSAKQGGDLDYFRKGQMVPPFEKTAFELEKGKVSDVVETEFGYHIIKVTDHKEAGATPFEQAKEGIVKELTQKKQSEFANQYIESLKSKASIVYPPGKEPKTSMPQKAPVPGVK